MQLQGNKQTRSQDFLLNNNALYIIPTAKYSPKYMEHLTLYSVLYFPSLHLVISFFHFFQCFSLSLVSVWITYLTYQTLDHKSLTPYRWKLGRNTRFWWCISRISLGNSVSPFARATALLQNSSWDHPERAFKRLEWKTTRMYINSTYAQVYFFHPGICRFIWVLNAGQQHIRDTRPMFQHIVTWCKLVLAITSLLWSS